MPLRTWLPILAVALAVCGACGASAEAVQAARRRNEAALVEQAEVIAAGDATEYVLVRDGAFSGRSADLGSLLAGAAGPRPLHRFVYRPVDHADAFHVMTFLPAGGHAAGRGFASALGLRVRTGAGGALTLSKDLRQRRFTAAEPRVLTVTLTAPGETESRTLRVAFDPEFEGPLLVTPETAAALGLERFEVPGRVDVQVALGRPFRARRALVRARIEELDAEAVVVAVFETRLP